MNTPAKQIVRALRGQWHGESGMACCPAHADRVPSLSVSDQGHKILVHCHAGCNQKAVVSALWRLGFWPATNLPAELDEVTIGHPPQANIPDSSKYDHAFQNWGAALQVEGTPAERYLRHRGIAIPIPASLRFAQRSFHGPTGQHFPVVIAAIHADDDTVSAIQRVFIRPDGLGKAQVTPAKMNLGFLGDGAVRVAPAGAITGLCEGWETGLSAMQLYEIPVWCALGASRMHRVVFPPLVRKIVIFADNDDAGRIAAERTTEVHRRSGRSVEIRWPSAGTDFNDDLILAGQQ